MDILNELTQGKWVGTLMLPDGVNGIQVTVELYGNPTYQRIINGVTEESEGLCMYKDKYDERQGNYVGGIVLCDSRGYPNKSEHYMLREFTWTGNISSGNGFTFL